MTTRAGRLAQAGLLAAALLVGAPTSASADTSAIWDETGPRLQGPANQLLRGQLIYTRKRTVFVAHLERASRKRTWVGGSIYYPDDSTLKVFTTYRQGELVARGRLTGPQQESTTVPIEADWDLERDRVRMLVRNAESDPKPFNDRAVLDVYTVTKGWMHGPHCEITRSGQVLPCNDDYISARLAREAPPRS